MTDSTYRQSLARLLPRRRISAWPQSTPMAAVAPEGPDDLQRDRASCEEARHRLRIMGRDLRRQNVAFRKAQRRCRLEQDALERRDDLFLQLNPVRTWGRLTSRIMLNHIEPPANVLFFTTPSGPAAALLELEGQALLNELEDWQPCTLQEWAALSHLADRNQLTDFCRDLFEMGIVAWTDAADAGGGALNMPRKDAARSPS